MSRDVGVGASYIFKTVNFLDNKHFCRECLKQLPGGVNRLCCADCSPYIKRLKAQIIANQDLYGDPRTSATKRAHAEIGEPLYEEENNNFA